MTRLALAFLVALLGLGARAAGADGPPLIEFSKPLPRGQGLGTAGYRSTEAEQAFAARVTEKPLSFEAAGALPRPENTSDAEWAKLQAELAVERARTQPAATYALAGQAGQYVGWFGIVRALTWDERAQQTRILVQHLYFDGLTDLHLQVVSYGGAGDFTAIVPGRTAGVPRLGLVRCYGRAGVGGDGAPTVTADYLRVWAWGLFTFMDYGPDRTNPAWVRLRQVAGEDAYSSRPDRDFYVRRLGPPD